MSAITPPVRTTAIVALWLATGGSADAPAPRGSASTARRTGSSEQSSRRAARRPLHFCADGPAVEEARSCRWSGRGGRAKADHPALPTGRQRGSGPGWVLAFEFDVQRATLTEPGFVLLKREVLDVVLPA